MYDHSAELSTDAAIEATGYGDLTGLVEKGLLIARNPGTGNTRRLWKPAGSHTWNSVRVLLALERDGEEPVTDCCADCHGTGIENAAQFGGNCRTCGGTGTRSKGKRR